MDEIKLSKQTADKRDKKTDAPNTWRLAIHHTLEAGTKEGWS